MVIFNFKVNGGETTYQATEVADLYHVGETCFIVTWYDDNYDSFDGALYSRNEVLKNVRDGKWIITRKVTGNFDDFDKHIHVNLSVGDEFEFHHASDKHQNYSAIVKNDNRVVVFWAVETLNGEKKVENTRYNLKDVEDFIKKGYWVVTKYYN